ncbi:hypothetical protein WYO_3675 [Methylobacterium sp. GXF4]|nr:hypothetical protein [Methylobacterium sp. GXF4]EIZ83662.1 hypothetical protein WYO_3675 [Methylobacterium sp. GXF4]
MSAAGALLAAPFIVSAAVLGGALLWCRGLFPLVVTTLGAGLVWVLVV